MSDWRVRVESFVHGSPHAFEIECVEIAKCVTEGCGHFDSKLIRRQ